MIPAGSSSALTARSAASPSAPASASKPRRVVAADRVVMGDRRLPRPRIASDAARLARSHSQGGVVAVLRLASTVK